MAVALGLRIGFGLHIVGPEGPAALASNTRAMLRPSTRVSLQWICPMSTKKLTKNRLAKAPAPPKTASSARTKKAQTGARKSRPPARSKRPLSPLEVQLRKALAEMGLARARRVFAAVEASFDD